MAFEVITAFLAAIGVLALAWRLVFWAARPRARGPLYITVSPRGADSLQSAAIQVNWMRRWGFDMRLFVAVDHLDREGLYMARLLQRDNRAVTLGKMEDFCAYDGGTAGGGDTVGHLQQ